MADAKRAARCSKSRHEVSVLPCCRAVSSGSASLMASQMVARCCSTRSSSSGPRVRSDLGGAVVDSELRAGDGPRVVTGQEEDGVGDVLGLGYGRVEPVLAHGSGIGGV